MTAAKSAPTLRQLVRKGEAVLAKAGIPSARLDAEVLLAEAWGLDRVFVLTRAEAAVPASVAAAYAAMLDRRAAREPLAYIVGHKEFWSLDMEITPAVLIPRPETEVVVETALGILSDRRLRRPSVCDVGTGSGCIAVAVAREVPSASVVGVDVSAAALEIARRNALKHQVGERVELFVSDLFAAVRDRRFDVVVANPPYVRSADLDQLAPELRWEPQGALDGGADGLEIIAQLLADAAGVLVSRGWLVMEIGAEQGPAVAAFARTQAFVDVRVQPDYAGLPRVLVAQAG